MKDKNAPTVKFCGHHHPEHDVGCVLESGHAGRHLGYLPVRRADAAPDGDAEAPPRQEVWWES